MNVRHDVAKKLAYFIKYLWIYCTNFRILYTIWKQITCKWWICSIFPLVKVRCHGNQLKSKNSCFYGPIYFVALPSGKGLQYRNSDFKRLDRMNIYRAYIVCNFGDIPSRNLRLYVVNNSTFCGDMAKIGISHQISQNFLDLPWPTLQVW